MTILRIAFRNLFRQKRRNLLLGSAIALGTAFLIIANAFAHGISDTLINRVISTVSGHVNITFAHQGKSMSQMLRGGKHWQDSLAQIPGIAKVTENIGILGRVVGHGKADNAALVGLDLSGAMTAADSVDLNANFHFIAGHWTALRDSTIENPMILSAARAKFLRVQVGDVLPVRAQNVLGNFVAARLTVVGIFEPANMFMESVSLLNLRDIAPLIGLNSEDSPSLSLILTNPLTDSRPIADLIWEKLQPPPAEILGNISRGARDLGTAVYRGYFSDSLSLTRLAQLFPPDFTFPKNQVLVAEQWAQNHGLKPGDTLHLNYPLRFPTTATHETTRLVIGGLFTPDSTLPPGLILGRDDYFYPQYYSALPATDNLNIPRDSAISSPAVSLWDSLLTTAWIRSPRVHSTAEMTKIQKSISQGKYHGTVVSVNTMYEGASVIMQLEKALQLITFQAVLLIFFIILIGVINTLGMTVRERTREIGTMRAIGMSSPAVRQLFLMETALLSLFAAVGGIALAFAAMALIAQITIPAAGNPLGILLVNNHLVFVPQGTTILLFVVLIVAITVLTAWLPARKAAKLPPATALRHYD